METVLTSVVVAALVSGGITLLTPWAKWKVEREQLRVQNRRDAVREWRKGVEAWALENPGGVAQTPASFIKTVWYFSLRPHLTDAERRRFEVGGPIEVVIGGAGDDPWNPLTRDAINAIDRIEKEWDLP